jgi:protoporphyrinogen oxidase
MTTSGAAPFDHVVLGAGQRGLFAALAALRAQPEGSLLVVDAAPQPGGSLRTQRTNGYVCELGAFSFTRSELEPRLRLLTPAPTPIAALPEGRYGYLPDGVERHRIDCDEAAIPLAFRTGNEELTQACRRALGNRLQLGRSVVALRHTGAHFTIELGGQVPATLACRQVTVALPAKATGQLLGDFDPALAAVAQRIELAPRAFVFLGGDARDAAPLQGYGIAPTAVDTAGVQEVIHCTNVFPARALPGRFLLRAEVAPATAEDSVAIDEAVATLARWTGVTGPFALQKVHAFRTEVADGALAECQARLRALPARVAGLALP